MTVRSVPSSFLLLVVRHLFLVASCFFLFDEVRVNLRSQIEELERQQRELMREVQSIDQERS